MRPTQFKIESLGYEFFDGFTKDEKWNGWNCPYFTFEQSRNIVKNYNQIRRIIGAENLARYDSATDAFIFPADDEDEQESFAAIVNNNQKFYPIGAFGWIWEEADK